MVSDIPAGDGEMANSFLQCSVYILGSGRWRYINKNDGELFLACSVIYIKAMAGPGVLYVLPARKLRKIRWAFNNLHAAH